MSAGFPVQTGTRFSASAGARAPSPRLIARSAALQREDPPVGRRQCCRERSARQERQGLQVSAPPQTQSARSSCPPLGGRERQPTRDREFARSSARVCALSGSARPLGLQQVAAEGDWGSGLNPGGPASWPKGLKECEGGAGQGAAAGSGRASSGCGAASERCACPGARSTRLPGVSPGRSEPGAQGWVRCSYAGQPRPFPTWVGEK